MRSFLLKLHYYLAFIFLLPLIIAGATGMVIAYDHAIEEKLYPELMQHGGEPLADRLAIDYDRAIAAAAPLQTDEQAITSVNAPRTEDTNILVTLGGKGNQREVYINPYTYELAGERGRDDSFMRTVYKLHATLLVRPAGDYVLLLSAVSLGLLSIGGIVNWLWHPSRKLQLRVKRKMFLRWWDTHRLAGVIASVFMLVIAASGGTMAYNHSLGRLLGGHQRPQPPTVSASSAPLITAAAAIAAAKPQFPDATVTHISPPNTPEDVWVVFMRQPDEPRTSKGMSSVALNPYTGEVVKRNDALARTGWGKWMLWVFPLHNGEWAGLPLRIVHSLMGFILVLLAYTGTRSWLARRKPKKKSTAPRPRRNLQKTPA